MTVSFLLITHFFDSFTELQLNWLLRNGEVFVHVDAIQQEVARRFRRVLGSSRIQSTYRTSWGSYDIVKAEVSLLRAALAETGSAYFALLSGSCIPVSNIDGLKAKIGTRRAWMTCRHIPKNSPNWSSRFGTIWLDDLELLGCRTRKQAVQRSPGHAYLDAEREKIIDYLEFSTSALRSGRYPPTGGEFYSGQQWWILDRGVAEHIVNAYSHNEEYWQTLALCRIPDEVLIQTIVGRFLKPDDIGPSQTFMSFDHPEKGRPAVWDTSDYETLISTEKLFARKVSWQQSEALVREIFRTI